MCIKFTHPNGNSAEMWPTTTGWPRWPQGSHFANLFKPGKMARYNILRGSAEDLAAKLAQMGYTED